MFVNMTKYYSKLMCMQLDYLLKATSSALLGLECQDFSHFLNAALQHHLRRLREVHTAEFVNKLFDNYLQ